jgi:hypothetical protein
MAKVTLPPAVQETLLTRDQVLHAYCHLHGAWDFISDVPRVPVPKDGKPVAFRSTAGEFTIYEAAGRHDGLPLYRRRSSPAPEWYSIVVGLPFFEGTVRAKVRDTLGVAFRYPEGDEKGLCGFTADRDRLSFARGVAMVVAIYPWSMPVEIAEPVSDRDRRAVESFLMRKDNDPIKDGAPPITDDDQEWIRGAFPMLDRLSAGWLSESDVALAEWYMDARDRGEGVLPGACGDALALQMIAAATSAREQEGAQRFAALWPSRRMELLEVIVLDRRSAPVPR